MLTYDCETIGEMQRNIHPVEGAPAISLAVSNGHDGPFQLHSCRVVQERNCVKL